MDSGSNCGSLLSLPDHRKIYSLQKFIKHLKTIYKQAGIFNSDNFFGVLHDLTDPELYPLACDWLRGDDLSEESLQALKIRRSIDTEETAWETLSNLGRISTETQPIVICFDQVENSFFFDGTLNPQPLFNINTTIHNEYLKNFLIVISTVTDHWKQTVNLIQLADKARIDRVVSLKRITLDQAEALWAYRLQPLHYQANPKPHSSIYPLKRQDLENKFPGGKTVPRNALTLGEKLFDEHKHPGNGGKPPKEKELVEFKLIWLDEYNKVKAKFTKITLLAAPEMILMLQEVLAALQIKEIKPKLLKGKFASYSLSYQQPSPGGGVGVVWTEDASMNSFFNVMNACQRVVNQNGFQTLYLIRAMDVGKPNLAGNQIYRQIFTGSHNRHIKPILSSVHDLAAYHSLVNSARAKELVVDGKTLNLKELEELTRKTEILHKCRLLQDLSIVPHSTEPNGNVSDLHNVKDFLLNLVIKHQCLARKVLIENAGHQFTQVKEKESEIDKLIQELCQENKFKIVNPKAKMQEQSICLVP